MSLSPPSVRTEATDVVIVGARCAGSAAAAAFARSGRRVVMIDRSTFPSDTMSTHTLFPAGVIELRRLGALDRVLALDPPRLREMEVVLDSGTPEEVRASEWFRMNDGIDFGISVPRDILDVELVAAAREAGAEVREGCTASHVLWEGGRAVGLIYLDAEGQKQTIRASLVVGADGRRSRIAAAVGAWTPYREAGHGRSGVYRYVEDPWADEPERLRIHHWRDGPDASFCFPTTPRGTAMVFFMGGPDDQAKARTDPEAYWRAKVAATPEARRRTAGGRPLTPVRVAGELTSYFRASSGPGWALAGDAGHFKDPILGQGMRDAFWGGRTLAEHTAAVLDDPPALDIALRRWEQARDAECLPMYFHGAMDTQWQPLTLAFRSILAAASLRPDGTIMTDLAQRAKTPQQLMASPVTARSLVSAVASSSDRRDLLRSISQEAVTQVRIMRQLRRRHFRSSTPVAGVERPVIDFPPAPEVSS